MSKKMKWKNAQATSLPVVYIKGQQYFFDEKQMELRKVDNPHAVYKFYQLGRDGNMNNFEVAEMYVDNALAYIPDVGVVEKNLIFIKNLLQNPTAINTEHDWSEFQ